ncbi:MAG: hypothetical protein KC457_16705, partial [Myxococcales bacterium]|nr:hypothetical protein [Myxococcales bacterium]
MHRRVVQIAQLVTIAAGACSLGCPGSGDDDEGDGDSIGDAESDGDTGVPAALPAPQLLTPTDGASAVTTASELCWSAVDDPEGGEVGYRVWVDDVELANGKTGEYGFASTCTGVLQFVDERSYGWRVRAFDLAEPSRESVDSETWTFTTAWEQGAKDLFVDDFSEDNGWTVSGAALTGAWVRGTPEAVYDADSEVAQPGACFAGTGCFFTGHNPGGSIGEADVDGGVTVLTSPPFDPGDSTSVSVSLARFFYRSTFEVSGLSLEVALLVPPPEGEDGPPTVHVLERLDGGPLVVPEPANAWSAVAYSACGVELRPGTRLRISAGDLLVPEAAVVEAAIDEVRVEGYPDQDICAPGPGALCDPADPMPACGAELLCCAQGPVFTGVHRCEVPVPEIGDAPPDQPDGELTGALGCDAPDLTVIDDDLIVYTQNIFVQPDACTLYEGCVGGSGWRRLLVFDSHDHNVGGEPLHIGEVDYFVEGLGG